jgi:uncharacterized protein (DUF2147 family)
MLFLLCAFLTSIQTFAQSPDDIVGSWLTSSKNVKITIEKSCSTYIGRITWIRDDSPESPKLDSKNTNQSLQNRPLLQLLVLNELRFDAGKKEWNNGKIYAYEDGTIYDCKIWMKNGELKVHGYKGVALLGRTDTWTRIKE